MRRVLLPAILLASLLALTVSLRPSVQRELLLEHAPATWDLRLDEILLLPWSLRVRGLTFSLEGVHYRIGKLDARFNPLTLITDTLTLHSLRLLHTEVDARTPEATPRRTEFPGLLALLNQGLALRLDALEANLVVRLPGGRSLSVRSEGGSLKPHVAGSLPFTLEYGADTVSPGGAEDAAHAAAVSLTANGAVEVSQLRQGRVRHLVLLAKGSMTTPAARSPERFDVSLKVAPPPGNLANPYRQRMTLVDGKQVAVPNPEALSLAAFLVGESGETRAAFSLAGLYRGDEGLLSTTWKFNGNQALVSSYLGTGTTLPDMTLQSGGALQWSLPDAQGRLNLAQTIAVTLPAATRALHLRSLAEATLDARNLTLENLQVQIAPENEARSLLSGMLQQPLKIPLAAPTDILEHARDLATLELGPFPLSALAGAVPGITLDGELSGRYSLRVEQPARLALSPLAPTRVTGATLSSENEVWLSDATLHASPTLRWSASAVRLDVKALSLATAGATPASMSLSLTRTLAKPESPWRIHAQGELDLGRLSTLPLAQKTFPTMRVPETLGLAFDGRIDWTSGEALLQSLALRAHTPEEAALFTLATRAAFPLTPLFKPEQSGRLGTRRLPTGDLLHVGLKDVPLAWLNPWLAHQSLEGRVREAGFTLSAEPEGVLRLRPDAVFNMGGFGLLESGRTRLSGLSLEASPVVRREGDTWSLAVSGLRLAAEGRSLATGQLEFRLARSAEAQMSYALSTAVEIDFGHLAHQPLLAEALPRTLPGLPLSGTVDLAVEGLGGDFTVERGEAALRLGPNARFDLQATPGLQIRTRLDAGENLARHAVGTLALEVRDLPSSTLSDFLSLGQVRFKEVNAKVLLQSDGRSLKVGSEAPLRLEAVRLLENRRALTAPFDLTANATLEATRRRLNLVLDEATLRFEGSDKPALAGRLSAGLTPGARVPLTTLDTNLQVDLVQCLAQPVLLSGHRLTGGTAVVNAKVSADRTLEANVAVAGLDAGKKLAIKRLELPITGALAPDGRGFDFSAPVLASGKSGATRATLRGHYAPQPDEPRVITLSLLGEVFYLNDLLAAWTAIAPAPAQSRSATAKPRAPSTRVPDAKAAWKLIPPAVVVDVAIDRLFYSDYLAFDSVHGELDLRSRRFGLQDVGARFHESDISFDGVMRFKAGAPEPYSLELKWRIKDFDLNTFFTELVPGEKPRVEGLLGVRAEASGTFANFSQLRNRLLFDVHMKSRDGLFRPLPPDSSLLLGASDLLGTLGEGLSYLPTGGFGAGAVARLVNYIAEIDYDTLDLHLVRKDPHHVQLEEFQLLSPTIALTATGDILHDPGEDILDSPLALTAELDMLGRGAAILYSLDLMRDEKDVWGYWRGPSFRIWGSLAAPESNFDEIVNAAGDAAVQGALRRPLSGLVGNLKFRWFDDDSAARERAREARRARDAAREAEEAAKTESGSAVMPRSERGSTSQSAVSPAP